KMAAAFRKAKPSKWAWSGVHECVCGALSANSDFELPNGEVTNSLCVQYVAHHRCEVPSDHLAIGRFGGDRQAHSGCPLYPKRTIHLGPLAHCSINPTGD